MFWLGFIAGVLVFTALWRVLIALASHWWPAPEDDEITRSWSGDDAAMREPGDPRGRPIGEIFKA
jgi:hypothetical protein